MVNLTQENGIVVTENGIVKFNQFSFLWGL